MNSDQFKDLVSRALKKIPEEFIERLENVEIIVEEEPSSELIVELGLEPYDSLFGLYQGVPRPGRHFFLRIILPDRITLFRNAFLRSCRSERKVMGKTLVHERAHHFGFAENRIQQLGY